MYSWLVVSVQVILLFALTSPARACKILRVYTLRQFPVRKPLPRGAIPEQKQGYISLFRGKDNTRKVEEVLRLPLCVIRDTMLTKDWQQDLFVTTDESVVMPLIERWLHVASALACIKESDNLLCE